MHFIFDDQLKESLSQGIVERLLLLDTKKIQTINFINCEQPFFEDLAKMVQKNLRCYLSQQLVFDKFPLEQSDLMFYNISNNLLKKQEEAFKIIKVAQKTPVLFFGIQYEHDHLELANIAAWLQAMTGHQLEDLVLDVENAKQCELIYGMAWHRMTRASIPIKEL